MKPGNIQSARGSAADPPKGSVAETPENVSSGKKSKSEVSEEKPKVSGDHEQEQQARALTVGVVSLAVLWGFLPLVIKVLIVSAFSAMAYMSVTKKTPEDLLAALKTSPLPVAGAQAAAKRTSDTKGEEAKVEVPGQLKPEIPLAGKPDVLNRKNPVKSLLPLAKQKNDILPRIRSKSNAADGGKKRRTNSNIEETLGGDKEICKTDYKKQ